MKRWYAVHKRTLPWRDLRVVDEHERAYQVLVSEVMLQQTQVERVKVSFKNFIHKFPLLKDLAKASNREILLQWQGMGYNSRALRLRDAAAEIVGRYGGKFPREMKELLAIKGIGPYTAAAIRNFAFHLPTPCIDTNIRRVLHRTFVGAENADGTWKKDDASLLKIAEKLLCIACADAAGMPAAAVGTCDSHVPTKRNGNRFGPHDWHAALMDFGSLVQTKRSPKWDVCPLTAGGIMKTTSQSFARTAGGKRSAPAKVEPGRQIAGRFVPNRIIRGRIVQLLRTHPVLSAKQIGPEVCIDWRTAEHMPWLEALLAKLCRDGILAKRGSRYALS